MLFFLTPTQLIRFRITAFRSSDAFSLLKTLLRST